MAEQLYAKYHTDENGNTVVDGYAYGEEWVSMALHMDDIKHATPEEAEEAWRKWKEKNSDSTLHSR